eukprot:Rhum_TRINITY_DN14814_c4_g1::Rhum_TRINITY_DN14814_c4_g1_i1::g.121599::m.121599
MRRCIPPLRLRPRAATSGGVRLLHSKAHPQTFAGLRIRRQYEALGGSVSGSLLPRGTAATRGVRASLVTASAPEVVAAAAQHRSDTTVQSAAVQRLSKLRETAEVRRVLAAHLAGRQGEERTANVSVFCTVTVQALARLGLPDEARRLYMRTAHRIFRRPSTRPHHPAHEPIPPPQFEVTFYTVGLWAATVSRDHAWMDQAWCHANASAAFQHAHTQGKNAVSRAAQLTSTYVTSMAKAGRYRELLTALDGERARALYAHRGPLPLCLYKVLSNANERVDSSPVFLEAVWALMARLQPPLPLLNTHTAAELAVGYLRHGLPRRCLATLQTALKHRCYRSFLVEVEARLVLRALRLRADGSNNGGRSREDRRALNHIRILAREADKVGRNGTIDAQASVLDRQWMARHLATVQALNGGKTGRVSAGNLLSITRWWARTQKPVDEAEEKVEEEKGRQREVASNAKRRQFGSMPPPGLERLLFAPV